MRAAISDLLGIVREEINLCRDLLEHARCKTALLVQGRVDAILESNRIEETFSARLHALESAMARLCNDLSKSFGIRREEFTLMKLADSLEPSLALEIRSQTALFKNMVRQLKTVNRRNRMLVEKSLRYSEGVLAIFSNATGSYQPTGLFEPIPRIQPTFSQRA